ncbi:PEP/pyruvate-binding domain-containing protein [Candidatus Berkiella aquae]|uniref:Adenylyltransferase/cytidyltransferase family protein n=1 Tax=Candidatus Berkiella aquae TaxID=295108 RepID=A0A0Q9YI28_9GAMM|nr:PEP/pyruvate-binding domain-containing protein [Candidatus Berkiella aquae]MCS5712323.1 adenylyltransferase/cytidyltransferase family protein [Candidatus Berkiella aquae]
MKIAYTFVISDLFHYGHLQLLEAAAKMSDKLICGVLTDDAVVKIGGSPISNYQERSGVINAIKYVNEVIPQDSQDPFENLQLLRQRFPQDEIIFVYGENWGEAPGGHSLNKINITLKQQSFYKKLSNNHIACKFVEKYYPSLTALDTFSERFVIPDFDKFTKEKPKFTVTTKANTLQKLKPLLKKSHIEKMYVFTIADWNHYAEEVLIDIKDKFNHNNIVIRSSCLNEDSMQESKAGHYQSILNICSDDQASVKHAITQVIHSYPQDEINLSDQVLVQRYTNDVKLSGVLFTRDLGTNAPYYVINYSQGNETDVVTSGKQSSLLKIFKHTHRRVLENQWQKLLEAIDEIEQVIPDIPLDIEFAIGENEQVVIFQVRPLSANVFLPNVDENQIETILKQQAQNYHQLLLKNQNILKGDPLILSDMAFWNPSELIGSHPSVLAYDLFNTLFMNKAWCYGLSALAYNKIKPQPLMYQFCNKPYINVNLAFLALIPENIPEKYHASLNHYYLNKLCEHRYLHDKVEFNILFTCYDFNLHTRMKELLSAGFLQEDIDNIEQALKVFTKTLIANSEATFADIENKMAQLEDYHQRAIKTVKTTNASIESNIEGLLSTCEELGTITFSTTARMAFIAESLIKSLVEINVLTLQEYNEIKQSFCTVAFELTQAIADVAKGKLSKAEFMTQYGHLRAGTYDITQCRYDQSEQMLFDESAEESKQELSQSVQTKLTQFLLNSSLNIEFESFYGFIKSAIEAREKVKLAFTKVISDVLEMLKSIGQAHHLSTEDLSMLELNEILQLKATGINHEKIAQRKAAFLLYKKLSLPALVTKIDDFMLINRLDAKPNFVTDKVVTGEAVFYHKAIDTQTLHDKIVFIESADPGFHWILAYKIKGIVTRYGGAASHMAICCAELGIPAAIGCGEKYTELLGCRSIRMDCVNQIIERIH